MSGYLYNGFSNGLSMDVDTTYSGGNPDIFINPQDTDKRYGHSQSTAVSNGMMTPPPQTRMDCSCRRPSLIISDATGYCGAGPNSAASTTSSFGSSPGCPSSCSSSASTAPSSRRQSTICTDIPQQHYYFNNASPSPSFRSPLPKETSEFHQPLQGPFSTEAESFHSNASSFSVVSGDLTSNPEDVLLPAVNGRMPWQEYDVNYGNMPAYESASRNNLSTYLSGDLVSTFSGSVAPRLIDPSQAMFEPQPESLPCHVQQENVVFPRASLKSSQAALGSSWEYQPSGHEYDTSCSDDDANSILGQIAKRRHRRASARKGKVFKRSANGVRAHYIEVPDRTHKLNRCQYCDYACNRPEHLKRHCNAKHDEKKELYRCKFPDCIDKKTGERRIIQSRGDNYKAHYTKTHFSYGSTEKTGKNQRKSMKMSVEEGLRSIDARWALMLAGKMRVGEDAKPGGDGKSGQNFSNVWKMIGYSIKETKGIKVKDIAPDWQGPDATTLDRFDCRWIGLRDGTLDYEQTMSVGTNMLETPRQGLLGVDMMETKEMGLVEMDPRWQMLLSGHMSVEDSEKLGVKQLNNPAWRALQARRKR